MKTRGRSTPLQWGSAIDNHEEFIFFQNKQIVLNAKAPKLQVKHIKNPKTMVKKRAQSIPILSSLRMDGIVTPSKNSYNIFMNDRPKFNIKTQRKSLQSNKQSLPEKVLGVSGVGGTSLLRRMIQRETGLGKTLSQFSTLQVSGESKQISPFRTSHVRRTSAVNFYQPTSF